MFLGSFWLVWVFGGLAVPRVPLLPCGRGPGSLGVFGFWASLKIRFEVHAFPHPFIPSRLLVSMSQHRSWSSSNRHTAKASTAQLGCYAKGADGRWAAKDRIVHAEQDVCVFGASLKLV